MTDARKLEVMTKLLEYISWKLGMTLSQEKARELGNIAKAIGCTVEEINEIALPIGQKLLERQFGKK